MREGLERTSLVPVGSAWADVQVGWLREAGPYGQIQGGWRPAPPVSVYGFARASRAETMAGLGVGLKW